MVSSHSHTHNSVHISEVHMRCPPDTLTLSSLFTHAYIYMYILHEIIYVCPKFYRTGAGQNLVLLLVKSWCCCWSKAGAVAGNNLWSAVEVIRIFVRYFTMYICMSVYTCTLYISCNVN